MRRWRKKTQSSFLPRGTPKFLSIYRRIIDEKDQKNGRNDLVKLKLKRMNHNETGRRI